MTPSMKLRGILSKDARVKAVTIRIKFDQAIYLNKLISQDPHSFKRCCKRLGNKFLRDSSSTSTSKNKFCSSSTKFSIKSSQISLCSSSLVSKVSSIYSLNYSVISGMLIRIFGLRILATFSTNILLAFCMVMICCRNRSWDTNSTIC